MIKRDKLLLELKELMRCKENILVLLQKNVSSAFSLSDMDADDQKDMIKYFSSVVDKQKNHVEMLKQIQGDLESGQTDVY